jgi:uncharacterized protein YlxP (DUF503 family)
MGRHRNPYREVVEIFRQRFEATVSETTEKINDPNQTRGNISRAVVIYDQRAEARAGLEIIAARIPAGAK